eukprot:1804014-Rhodomonas_salina.4
MHLRRIPPVCVDAPACNAARRLSEPAMPKLDNPVPEMMCTAAPTLENDISWLSTGKWPGNIQTTPKNVRVGSDDGAGPRSPGGQVSEPRS